MENKTLRQTKNINPKLMMGDEITVLDIDKNILNINSINNSPQLFKDYVVVGVRYRQRENWEGPDADTSYYHIEPKGMADDEFLDSPLTLHASDKWIHTNDISLNESLRQTKNLNPDLMVGDEIMVVSTKGIHDFGTPELFKPYVVVGIKYGHLQTIKRNQPYNKPFFQIEPLGMTDKDRTGAMLAGGGRARPLYIFSPDDGHTGSDQWILRPGFLRGELEEEGETNEAARTLSKARKAGVDTYYPKSAVKANPERFRKYTRDKYLNENIQQGLNPELKVGDTIRVIDVDGEHTRMPKRFGIYKVVKVGNADWRKQIYYDMIPYPDVESRAIRHYKELGAHHEDSDFTLHRGDSWIFWGKDKDKYKKGFLRGELGEQGADTSWANDDDKVTLQDILELTKDIPTISYPTKELAKLPSLKKIVLGWDPEEIERISQVDVSRQYPILVMVNEYNEVQWILDGNHRAQQAVMNNIPTIPTKLIKPSDLDERALKMFYPEGISGKNQKINEDKESINNMVYIEKPRKKHLQKMDSTLGNFKEFNWEKFKNTPPPKNNSKATEDEIKEVQKIKVNKKFVDTTDDIHEHFEDFLKTKDIEYPKKEVNKSMKGLSKIIIELKYHYNRPRPGQIAEKKKIKLKPTTLDTASTPAYPSGHALRGRFIGRYLSEKYPKYKKELMKLGDEVGDGRLMAKVHYPSDNKFGKKIGDELYNHYTTKYKKMISEQVDSEDYGIIDGEKLDAERKENAPKEPDTNNQPFTRKEVIIINYLSKKYNMTELLSLWEGEVYGKEKEKWLDNMKLFGIYADQGEQPDNFVRSTQYARWAWDNWEEAKKYDMDFGKIPNPLKIPLKWYEVEKEETGSQVEYRRGDAQVLGFDEDNAGERADYDFYSWGADLEVYDYGDYESYDSDITSSEFIRMDESVSKITPDKNPQTQELLFNFWKKVGPTMETDKLKLIGFDMNDNQDISTVSMNLVEYYGDEEIMEIIAERLEGIQGWEYEYVVTSIDFSDLINPDYVGTSTATIMIDVMVNGDQEVPITTSDDDVIDITLWEANERARKEWKGAGPGPYDNTYEDVREQVLSDISVLLKNIPVEPMLDYVEFSEPDDSIDDYLGKIEIIEDLKNWSYDGKKVGTVKEQVMVDKGDMLKSDIFKILSNKFILTPTDYSEIKDNEGNYYGMYDIKLEEYVNMSDLIQGVSDFISYGVESGDFKEKDVEKGITAITDWVSLMMNQKKDLPN